MLNRAHRRGERASAVVCLSLDTRPSAGTVVAVTTISETPVRPFAPVGGKQRGCSRAAGDRAPGVRRIGLGSISTRYK